MATLSQLLTNMEDVWIPESIDRNKPIIDLTFIELASIGSHLPGQSCVGNKFMYASAAIKFLCDSAEALNMELA